VRNKFYKLGRRRLAATGLKFVTSGGKPATRTCT
jgi:hypothetical protein